MASRTRRFFQSPLRVVLVIHGLCALASLAVLVAGLIAVKQDPPTTGPLGTIGNAVRGASTGAGGMTLLWVVVIPLAVLMAAAFLWGLVCGKWGLPGYLQGRAVLFVPPLAAVYFVVGRLVLSWIDHGGLGAAWQSTQPLVTTSAGLMLVLLYAALSTAAVGVGWAIALAITRRKRLHGKWETIGYVEPAR